MNYIFSSRLGKQLYQLLPEVYRTRDRSMGSSGNSGSEDLAKYLDAHGHLLDLIHATLEQQLKDTLPESSQEWLLPYYAQLLAVNLVSPEPDGRHEEIARAVSWRQRKGTLACIEEIAEAVGQMEVEIQEGWKRVAMTPRIDMPIMPVEVVDDEVKLDKNAPPSQAARHPSLPAVTVDLRRASRAVETLSTNPAAKSSNFGGVRQTWRQANVHGAPCFPDGFDDVSRRTVDIRTPDAVNGQYHHKRLLAYAPPPVGMFPLDSIGMAWSKRNDPLYEHLIEEQEEGGTWVIRNRTDRIIEITDDVELTDARPYRVEGLNFKQRLWVEKGRLELCRVEAVEVQVDTSFSDDPVLTASDCLFNELSVGSGSAKLDSCTILTKAYLYDIDAIDCIFMDMTGTNISGVIRSSRIPANPPVNPANMTIKNCTTIPPEFFGDRIQYDINNQRDHNGAGVLRPDCSADIYAGSSENGEMGRFHRGRKGRAVRIDGIRSFDSVDAYPLEDLIFEDEVSVTSGSLKLVRIAVREIAVHSAGDNVLPVLNAKDCLFDNLTVAGGLARLEYCTVMAGAACKYLQASDSIFAGKITDGAGNDPETEPGTASEPGCVRYSRIPEELDGSTLNVRTGRSASNTREKPIFGGLPYCVHASAISALVVDPDDSNVIYAGTNGSGVFKSSDGGSNWTEMNEGLAGLTVQALAVDPDDSNIIHAGTNGSGVFRSSDGGTSWAGMNTGLSGPYGLYIQALAIDPDDSNVIYAGTNGGGVFKSSDGGSNWTEANGHDPANLTSLNIQTLVIDSHDSNVVYAGTDGGGVFKSSNGGSNWTEMNEGLTDLDIQALLAIDSGGSTTIYAGTHGGGVFKSSNGGSNWTEMNEGLTDPNVHILTIDSTGAVYAGTDGGRVFRWDNSELEWVRIRKAVSREKTNHRNSSFGEPGYGVLDPATSGAIRFGAEDGGEMGAYHHKYYSLKVEAVLNKMREFLPVGIEPVLIQDIRLLHLPPELPGSQE